MHVGSAGRFVDTGFDHLRSKRLFPFVVRTDV